MMPVEKLSRSLLQEQETPVVTRPAPRPAWLRISLTWAVLTAAALWTAGGFVRASVLGYQIDALQAESQVLTARHQGLEAQLSAMTNPAQLAAFASAEHLSSPPTVLVVKGSGSAPARMTTASTSAWKSGLDAIEGAFANALVMW